MAFAFLQIWSNINDWVFEFFENLVTAQESVD